MIVLYAFDSLKELYVFSTHVHNGERMHVQELFGSGIFFKFFINGTISEWLNLFIYLLKWSERIILYLWEDLKTGL